MPDWWFIWGYNHLNTDFYEFEFFLEITFCCYSMLFAFLISNLSRKGKVLLFSKMKPMLWFFTKATVSSTIRRKNVILSMNISIILFLSSTINTSAKTSPNDDHIVTPSFCGLIIPLHIKIYILRSFCA